MQTTSKGSAASPISLSLKKKPRTIKVKVSKKKSHVAEIFSKPLAKPSLAQVVPINQVFVESKQPITALTISYIPYIFGSSSLRLPAHRPKGIDVRDLLPESTRSGFNCPLLLGKEKENDC